MTRLARPRQSHCVVPFAIAQPFTGRECLQSGEGRRWPHYGEICRQQVPYYTTLSGAAAVAEAIAALKAGGLEVRALQEYF
jgi:hypothetical protein